MEKIPSLGFGTWKIPKEIAEDIVYQAITIGGIRHIDCACDYGNEIEVGYGIKKAIDHGYITRDKLWITSKLWNTYHQYEHVELACRKSLVDLQLTYFDLYLIHFPIALKYIPFELKYPPEWTYYHHPPPPLISSSPSSSNSTDESSLSSSSSSSSPNNLLPRVELDMNAPMYLTWKGMENLIIQLKLTRYIGVCNFNIQLLMDLLSYAKIKPYMNQIELHPYLPQQVLVDFCYKYNIQCTAYSPLGSPSYQELNMDKGLGVGLLNHHDIITIASTHNKTSAQILLRWNLQRNIIVIPKSTKIERIIENSLIFDFELTEEEMTVIASLDKHGVVRFNDPGEFCKGMGGAIPIYN